jgi:Zn-dependent peptidase ImmA (M78 family)/DNA-binding XRE family transcriptional regulator
MESIPTAITLLELSERLRNARKAAGLSQEEAAAKTGMLQPTISAIEAGKRNVDTLELAKFAEVYGKPIHYFFDLNFKDESKSFIALQESRKFIDSDRAVLDDFRIFCQDYADLEQLVLGKVNLVRVFDELAVPKTKQEAEEQGARYAKQFLEIFDIGVEPTYDVRLFLDTIGIKAIKRKLNTPDCTGIYVYSPELGHCLLVNRSGNRQIDRFSMTHSFSHALLDWQSMDTNLNFTLCSNWADESLREYRANMFALNFLMPKETVEKVWLQIRTQEKPGLLDTIVIARYFGVDYESTLYRFVMLGLVTASERNILRDALIRSGSEIDGLLGYKISEVRISGEELYPDRYIKLAHEAFRLGKISVGRLAKYLGMNIYDTNQLVQKLSLKQIQN